MSDEAHKEFDLMDLIEACDTILVDDGIPGILLPSSQVPPTWSNEAPGGGLEFKTATEVAEAYRTEPMVVTPSTVNWFTRCCGRPYSTIGPEADRCPYECGRKI